MYTLNVISANNVCSFKTSFGKQSVWQHLTGLSVKQKQESTLHFFKFALSVGGNSPCGICPVVLLNPITAATYRHFH